MGSQLRPGVFAVCCVGFALPAFAQLDTSALRAKFGSPLNRETFHIPAGFDLVVDYGAGNQVCKLEVPALMPTDEKVQNTAAMKQRMYDFLAEVVPASMRGKELRRMAQVSGTISLTSVDYEYVTISELQVGDHHDRGTITLRFKNYDCQRPAGQ